MSQTSPSPIYPTRDLRAAALRSKLGARGYGIYCLLLEEMANQSAEYLRYDLKTLAWILRASEKTIESVIKDFDLFELTPDGKFFRHREEPDRPKAPTPPTEQLLVSPTEQPLGSPTEQPLVSSTEQPLESFEPSSVPNGDAGSLPNRAEARTKPALGERAEARIACPATDRTKAPSAPALYDPEIDLALSAALDKCSSDQLIEVMSLVKDAREDLRRKRASPGGDP